MVRWLTRLFGTRDQADDAPAQAPPSSPQPVAPTKLEAAVAVIETPVLEPELSEELAVTAVETTEQTKETCPDCGRTSVFAGPPGHRYCMHCALRNELFDKTASS